MTRILNKGFFDRPTLDVAQELLGKQLCRRLDSGKIIRALITETEAYDGSEDRASHAHCGLTTRNVVMFGAAGRGYIYLCYGVHWLFNVTTGKKGYPAAVLIRGVRGIEGPGRLTKQFQIDRRFNDKLLTRVGGLWIEESGVEPEMAHIAAKPRVGIEYAGPEWAAKPWRFVWSAPHAVDPTTSAKSCI